MLTLLKGSELKERYVVHDVIGTGGYASVWKASDKQLNRDVALKRLLKQGFAPAPDLAALLDEAQKNARLVHTNIVQIYDIIEVDDEHLIVMEYVDGQSLNELLREKARKSELFPLDRSISTLREILAGVAFAHSKNLCHRDLSPMNILVTSSGIPKIADFGIARVLESRTTPAATPATGTQGGTGNPNFMSPEQARGEPADFSSDLFMVGIIGYSLLTGRHPFAHSSGLFSIVELLRDPDYVPDTPRPQSSLTGSQQRLFREYVAVVMRLLHRERAGRFASAQEAIAAIEAVTPSLDCPACGERVPEHHKFCGYCGATLQTSQVAPSTGLPQAVLDMSPEDLVEQGYRLGLIQKWDAAMELYRLAMQKDPNLQKAYRNLGYALNRIGEYEDALNVLSDGLKVASPQLQHQASLYHERAYANANLKHYPEALTDIQKALSRQPDSPKSLYLRARINLYRGDIDAARSDAHQVLRFVPDHSGAIRLLDELR